MSTTLASTLLSSSIAIGPQGVQGTAGYIGADGAQGVQGALGGDPYWNTISSNTQAVPFGRYVTNSQTGSFTITLPSSPETGNYIQIADVGYWGTNNVTVARNGNLIEGLADDLILDATGTFIELIYTGTSWELVSSLGRRGVQGAQGLQGVQGVQGIQGDFGVQGLQGIQGLQGPQSTQGIQGIRGDIIYQESLSNLTNSTGTVVHNTAINSIWVHTSISGNITVNFTNVNTTDNTILTFLVILLQGATARSLSAVQIDGVAQTINWFDNVVPTATINKKEFYTFNLLRTSNAWTVMGSMASYG